MVSQDNNWTRYNGRAWSDQLGTPIVLHCVVTYEDEGGGCVHGSLFGDHQCVREV